MASFTDFYRAARSNGYTATRAFTLAKERLAHYSAAHFALLLARDASRCGGTDAQRKADSARSQRCFKPATSAARYSYNTRAIGHTNRVSDGGIFYERPTLCGLRFIGDVVPDTPRGVVWQRYGQRLGWYTRPDGYDNEDSVWGVVYQSRSVDGCAVFIPGIVYGHEPDSATLYHAEAVKGEREDNCSYSGPKENQAALDAARIADGLAQKCGEEERDYNTAYMLGSDYANAGAVIAEERKDALALLADRRAVGSDVYAQLSQGMRDAIRDKVRHHLAAIRDARKTRAQCLNGSHGDMYIYMDATAKKAFCDGAGLQAFPTH